MLGKKINTLRELDEARLAKKACIFQPKQPWHKKPIPAAFLINMTGDMLLRLFDNGMYIYKKQ